VGTPRPAAPRSRGSCCCRGRSPVSRGLQGSASHTVRHGSGHVQLRPTRTKQANARHAGPEWVGGLWQPPRGARGRAAGPPVSHPHLSHAHPCSPRPLSPSMPPCCSSPLGRQECAPRPCRPTMPFTSWLHRRLRHRRCKVTPNGREQMVPCHRCHPGTPAWACRPGLTVGKAVLPTASHPDPRFAQPPGAAQPSSASLQLPWLARDLLPPRLRPKGGSSPTLLVGSRSCRAGEGPTGRRCPLAARRGTGHRLADRTQGRLGSGAGTGCSTWASRLAQTSSPHPAPGVALLQSHASTHPGGCCHPPQRDPRPHRRVPPAPQPRERCHAVTGLLHPAHAGSSSCLGLG